MKKYGKWLLILPLLLFSGCQQADKEKETETESLSKADAAFVWQSDQEKKFGDFDYMVTHDEVEDELKDRFKVELLPSFFELEEAFQSGFSVDGATEKGTDYQIVSSDYQLIVARENGFSKGDELVSLGTVKATYEFMSSSQKVKLASQEMEILNWTGDGKFQGKSLEDTVKKLAEILQLENVDQLVADFKEKVADEEAIKGEIVAVYKDAEDAPVAKTLTVQYTDAGVVERVFVKTVNNQK